LASEGKSFLEDLLLASTLAQDITTVRQLSAKLAMEAVTAALDSCVAEGYRVSVAIVDRTGLVRATVRGDGAGPHTHESALRKAYTSATLGALTSELATRIQDPNLATLKDIPGVLFLAGGVPESAWQGHLAGILTKPVATQALPRFKTGSSKH
jgi:uncharacterized protein GlcG (DUF336 family)